MPALCRSRGAPFTSHVRAVPLSCLNGLGQLPRGSLTLQEGSPPTRWEGRIWIFVLWYKDACQSATSTSNTIETHWVFESFTDSEQSCGRYWLLLCSGWETSVHVQKSKCGHQTLPLPKCLWDASFWASVQVFQVWWEGGIHGRLSE